MKRALLPRRVEAARPVELFFLENAAKLRGWGTDLAPPPLAETDA